MTLKINLGTLTIESPAFAHGTRMPDDQSSNGSGASPELRWSGVPSGTQSFALVAHDADAPLAGGFSHWVLYGIPGDLTGLPEGGGTEYVQGANGLGESGWVPAGPPPGHGDHFYYFHLYALDADSSLEAGLTADQLIARIDPHILEQARVVGTYSNA
jgi:Raf kinase inhibitor-like YbhB/YbcL family protein